MNVKLNDTVVVIVGRPQKDGGDKGKQGKVIATSPKSGTVTVEGINVHKKAQKARKANETSQQVDVELPINVSNVMVVCDACGMGVRVRHSVVDGKKVRVCAKCGAVLDKAYAGKGKGKAADAVKEAPKKRTRKRAAKEEGAETETPAEDKAE
ncbi:MAG: 50S ribosomal protein L24 [Clostridia bacterium]|nr:50S ribosomal protein L24 [Clostridia bacterium]